MLRYLLTLIVVLTPLSHAAAQKKNELWTPKKAMAWDRRQPWMVGCNYLPSTAINQLEMWQADTFDPKTIDRELGWAKDLGFNSVRVFLHDLPWKEDSRGFTTRIRDFLEIAEKHKIKVIFVLFDSCWHPEPKSGKQPAPTPHVHNSGWVQSPGVAVLKDQKKWRTMEDYVTGIIHQFSEDDRIVCWDLWNEPDNDNADSYGDRDIKDKEKHVLPLVKQVFEWARKARPRQPITSAPWRGDWSADDKLSPLNRFLLENSDIITFHRYENFDDTKKSVESLKRYGRPIYCTEYMARPIGSTFEKHLPYFRDQKIGAYCWGFVSGKTQTIYPWDSWKKKYDAAPEVWFHDILHANGKDYDEKEIKLIKKVTGRDIVVTLKFSVETLDPLKPGDSFIECKVRNGSDRAVQVPTTYGAGFDETGMTLRAKYWHDLRLVVWAGKAKQKTKTLQPGEEMTVFKDSLTNVFLLDVEKEKPLKPNEERYYWSWSA